MRIDSSDILKRVKENKDDISESSIQKKREQKLIEAENVAKEFETLFIDMMIKSMRETAKPDDESNAHNIFQGMLDGEYAKVMAESHSFGIRDLVLNWMKDNDPELNNNIKTISQKELQKAKKEIQKINSFQSNLAIEQFKLNSK